MMINVPPPSPEEQTAIRKVLRKVQLPSVSGKASVLIMLLCFILAAAGVFLAGWTLHLPMWIDFEIMLAVWWIVWIAALSHLLFHGLRVSHDHSYGGGRAWWGRGTGGGWSAADLASGGGDVEGCAWLLGIIVAVVLAIGLAWLLVEIILPVLAVILYALIQGMMARVVNDDHGCTGRFGKALLWGTVWATAYTAPLAILVWVVHLIVAQRAGSPVG